MKSGVGPRFAAAVVIAFVLSLPATALAKGGTRLEMYTLVGPGDKIAEAAHGVELAGQRQTAAGLRADAVLTGAQRAKLEASGVKVTLKRNKKGQTVSQQAAAMAVGGYTVWRSWDEDGGIRDELYSIASRNPQLVKLEVLGHTHQGRELIALKVTQGARDVPDGARPAVLYSSNQHAREWISLEVNRRTLSWFIEQWRENNNEVKRLLKHTELWFVISANPDGYQYTFDTERLWRKNLRDNNGDGKIEPGDGVDPNRNFAEHWGYDNEGSSPDQADETYRGPSAESEPETQFMAGLIRRIKPKFQSNFHSFGQWLLYPQGRQTGTLDADNPIYVALGGTDANDAIPGFNVGQSADTLYMTNGETTDFADTAAGTIAYTPELGEARRVPASSSPTTRLSSRRSSRRRSTSRLGWRAPRRTRRTRCHLSESTSSRSTSTRMRSTRRTGSSRCSTSSSPSRTATRRRCGCSRRRAWARSR